jgi:hypothetical protein
VTTKINASFASKLAELRAAKKEYQDKIKNFGKAALGERFQLFFNEHPEVRAIYWTQYTPYFNDGEACVFGVNEFEAVIPSKLAEGMALESDEDMEIGDEECARVGCWTLGKKFPAINIALGKLQKDCNELDDVMEDTFGDHVQVVASPKGFDVEQHEHD